jgi:hypothetical protein
MERLDQSHIHPKLEVPRLTCPGRESNPGLRGGRRALFEQLVKGYVFGTSTYIRVRDNINKPEPVLWNRNRNRRNRNFFASWNRNRNSLKSRNRNRNNYGSGTGTRYKIMYLITFT